MNFDTPPQALTICGEWNKIFEDTRHMRYCLKRNYADGKDKEVKLEIVGTVES